MRLIVITNLIAHIHGSWDAMKDRLFVLVLGLHLKKILLLSKVELMLG